MSSRRPNIVFIMPDQWRHDAFGFAGNPVIETPNVDALAAQGAVFRGAHCESPVCRPSRASLVTGSYPRDHGVLYLRSKRGFPAPDEFETFPQRLRDAGYYTAEIGKMHFGFELAPARRSGKNASRAQALEEIGARRKWVERFGFDSAMVEMDKRRLIAGSASDYTEYLRRNGLLESWRAFQWPPEWDKPPRILASEPEPLEPDDTLDMFIARQASQFLRDYERDQPFFLWVAPVGPHPPFDAPSVYTAPYEDVEIPLGDVTPPSIPDNPYGEVLHNRLTRFGSGWDAAAIRQKAQTRARKYYANCTQDDAVVGRVMSALEEHGHGEDTWVVFGSDHGEMLGDHGLNGKGLFYRSSVQIPSVIKPPHGLTSPIVIDQLTQGFDLCATMLDIAGANSKNYLGQSLLPALNGATAGREAVVSEFAGFCMVATKCYKLVADSATGEPQQLFDLEDDPDERIDLCPDPQGRKTARMLTDRYVRPFLAGEWQPGPRASRSEQA